jgi:hypothetical protein
MTRRSLAGGAGRGALPGDVATWVTHRTVV